ncbi:hypothetical protein Tco_0415467 [Tanacetum coccineum]
MRLEESLESTQERIAGSGEAMEASQRRRRSILDYIIQQLSKGSSEGSGIIPEVLDEPKDNSGSSSSSFSGSDDEVQDVSNDEENKGDENKSMMDVPIHQEDPTVQRTPLIDTFEQRLSELEKKVESMPKRAWTKKDQKRNDEMIDIMDPVMRCTTLPSHSSDDGNPSRANIKQAPCETVTHWFTHTMLSALRRSDLIPQNKMATSDNCKFLVDEDWSFKKMSPLAKEIIIMICKRIQKTKAASYKAKLMHLEDDMGCYTDEMRA